VDNKKSPSTIKSRYRISTNLSDILEAVRSGKQSTNFLWHSIGGKRHTYPVEITDLKVENNKILIAVENKTDTLKNEETVYLRLMSRDAVFKSKVRVMNDFEVVLDFPTEILLCEKRKSKREGFHITDEKFAKIKSNVQKMNAHLEKVLKIQVLNMSESGLSLFIPDAMANQFNSGGELSLDALGDFWLHPPIAGTVVSKSAYAQKTNTGQDEGFQVGVNLNQKIPVGTFANFLVRPSLHKIDEKRLVADTVFRDKVHENMAATLKKIEKNKKLKSIFERINFENIDADYMKIHIKLLCEVLCGVGTKVGWVSEKTMDKLVYAAYMHDVAIMDSPKLARVQSKQELLRRKDEFSEADQKRYLDAPAYAAEMARLDSESYPDVVKILLQQRELPDGTGFPGGLTSAQLTPLSSLFIFCHYLVDYTIENPNWTLDNFVKTYQRLLKGTYFTKIFQAIT
jgi:HD-GYP domain-containing protein (c-di-GMP phosphodiesterase class II)